ncbi:DUF805 domain-containing protein [Brevundimonas sp.]|uniref:DUF805 domain-containing protein n=1 Tax=Brevundimonas sp. TaxID=1871086 RepID=UPI002FCA07FF
MANPIIRGFRNLTRFSGRDTRGQFWPYAGVVFALVFLAFGVSIGLWMNALFADMSAFAAAHPDAATVHSSPGQYSIQIDGGHPEAPVPDFTLFFVGMGLMLGSMVLLLAAAVSRRLHDRNLRAYWGLLPVPFLVIGMTVFLVLMDQTMQGHAEPNFGLFALLFLNNLVYMVALVSLIVMLAMRGAQGENRFG